MGTFYFIEVIDVPIKLKIKTIQSEIDDTLIRAIRFYQIGIKILK